MVDEPKKQKAMREARLLDTRKVPVAEIDTTRRKRPVSEKAVAAIIASVEDMGHIKDPVDLRRMKDGRLRLMAGGHRVEAARQMGWTEIRADIWDCTDDWAEIMEIDDNLAGADLTPLDTAIFLADRKRLYEKLHPETKRGVAGAAARWNATSHVPVASFVTASAEKFGQSETKIYRLVAAGERLDARDRDLLRKAPAPITQKDLFEIARVSNPAERYHVVEALSEGKAKSAADARKSFNAAPTPPKDPVEEAFQALMARWTRAPIAVRRRFVDAIGDDLIEMQEAGDE